MDKENFLYSYINKNSIELISLLGAGTYGVVYKGRYTDCRNRYCAVKCIEECELSQTEVDIHTAVTGHPSILSIEKIVKEKGHVFIIMEYAEQGDLFTYLTKAYDCSNTTTSIIRHLFLQILDAVQHCHYQFVAHRDIKPENILLLPNDTVKLADFGFATTQLISRQFHCGSSTYLSPECQGFVPYYDSSTQSVKSHNAVYYETFANDVWSLGVTLINIVFKQNPWSKASLSDPAFLAYVKNPRGYFRAVFPAISSGLEHILLRIFELDVSKRITLSGLKSLILGCRSFTTNGNKLGSRPRLSGTSGIQQNCVNCLSRLHKPQPLTPPMSLKRDKSTRQDTQWQALEQSSHSPNASEKMAFTYSLTNTILTYIDGFADTTVY